MTSPRVAGREKRERDKETSSGTGGRQAAGSL